MPADLIGLADLDRRVRHGRCAARVGRWRRLGERRIDASSSDSAAAQRRSARRPHRRAARPTARRNWSNCSRGSRGNCRSADRRWRPGRRARAGSPVRCRRAPASRASVTPSRRHSAIVSQRLWRSWTRGQRGETSSERSAARSSAGRHAHRDAPGHVRLPAGIDEIIADRGERIGLARPDILAPVAVAVGREAQIHASAGIADSRSRPPSFP